jgi:hypothetical protein
VIVAALLAIGRGAEAFFCDVWAVKNNKKKKRKKKNQKKRIKKRCFGILVWQALLFRAADR